MSHAEAFHTLQPAAGATDALVSFAGDLHYDTLADEVRHYARRHLLDTIGVMIAEVRSLTALAGYRGRPAGDLDALAHAIVALSRLAGDASIAEAEINPLIVRPAGEGVVAVDALVKLAGNA